MIETTAEKADRCLQHSWAVLDELFRYLAEDSAHIEAALTASELRDSISVIRAAMREAVSAIRDTSVASDATEKLIKISRLVSHDLRDASQVDRELAFKIIDIILGGPDGHD